ncbi:MAG: hypothetical protein Q4E87_09565, partial [bacterium]|nr:hypothetical protein [bacterium]
DLNPKEVDGEPASNRDIGNVTPYDTITGREITANETLTAGSIQPKGNANIGSANQKFNCIYASKLIGVYPVGAIYLSTSNISPASFLGGNWKKLPEGYALWTASSGAGGTISAGLPNITGSATLRHIDSGNVIGAEGALSREDISGSYSSVSLKGSGNPMDKLILDASVKGTTLYGKSSTVQPPAYKVYAWRRTA